MLETRKVNTIINLIRNQAINKGQFKILLEWSTDGGYLRLQSLIRYQTKFFNTELIQWVIDEECGDGEIFETLINSCASKFTESQIDDLLGMSADDEYCLDLLDDYLRNKMTLKQRELLNKFNDAFMDYN